MNQGSLGRPGSALSQRRPHSQQPAAPRGLPRGGVAVVASATLAGLALLAALPNGRAAVLGGARALPLAEALQRSREAAETVLERGGRESCLRGKLTNALVGLSASCAAQNGAGPICALAHRAAVRTSWTLAFMDSTSRELLRLLAAGDAAATSAAGPTAEAAAAGAATP